MISSALFINAAYAVFLLSLIVKDMLWLRVMMSAASILCIIYALMISSRSVLVWNIVFLGINLYHVVRIMIERRPIELPDDLEEVYQDCFANMSRRDFLNFWGFGREIELEDERVCKEGSEPSRLFYIIDGRAEVSRNGEPLAIRDRLSFIAELSFFTGQPASADVKVEGKAMTWTRDTLANLKKIRPDLVKSLRESIGRSVCQKLIATSP